MLLGRSMARREKAFRFRAEKERGGYLLRFWHRWVEYAWIFIGLRGLRLELEFPSDWHEHRRAWLRIGLGLISINFSWPWKKVVPDDGQCSGPRYGFYFFDDHLVLLYGKSKGTRHDPSKFINMPWSWRHREHKVLSEPETHPYRYTLRSGEVQERTATIYEESRLWTRYWLPRRLYKRSINIEFNDEVGEKTGSWKGGVLGTGFTMKQGETALQCLRRFEREVKL
jgi:hypothetical protein